MTEPKTLLQLAGADMRPARVADATLLLIDLQNEYLDGPIAVEGAEAAVGEAARLLAAARSVGAPVIHVAHRGRAGSLFDRSAPRGQIVDALIPSSGENIIEKGLPNAFAGTTLAEALEAAGRKELLIAGFMTHMCVSSTARAALDAGYRASVVASACGTRALPDGAGGLVDAGTLHRVSLVALSDRFAVIAPDADAVL